MKKWGKEAGSILLQELQIQWSVIKGVGISSRVDLALGVRHPKTGGLQTQFSPLPGKGRSALQLGLLQETKATAGTQKGQLPVGIFVCETPTAKSLRRAGGSVLVKYMDPWNPLQPIRISWSPTWEFENNLDECYARLSLIITCCEDKVGQPKPFVHRLPKAISWTQLSGHNRSLVTEISDFFVMRHCTRICPYAIPEGQATSSSDHP